jgi:hypothetical protein
METQAGSSSSTLLRDDLHNHQVSTPGASVSPENVNLAYAPTNPREFSTIAVRMVELLKPKSLGPIGSARVIDDGETKRGAAVKSTTDGLILRRDDHLGIEASD